MKKFVRMLLVIQLLVLLTLMPSSNAASSKSRSKKKIAKEVKEVNICDLERQEAPIFCYCTKHQLRNATDTNCVVFNKFDVNDALWSHFTTQTSIQKLTFTVKNSGSLTYVPTQMLKQLINLQIVTIQYANIHEVVEHAFSDLSTITEIHLSRDTIVVLRKFAFENLKNVSIINLDENRIAEVNRDVFVNLPSLTKLFLNHNNITILHDKAFKHLSSLQELELSGNQISVITSDSFNGLRNLQRLDLRSNLVPMIGDRSFVEMPELRELELDQNQISYISEKALEGMRHLRKLSLSENKLVNLEPDFLSGAPGIHFLDLRDNALKTMTFENVKPIIVNLYNTTSSFYLDDNKLICDCKLSWIWGLRNETKNVKLRDSLEVLTCFLESNNVTVVLNEEAERNQALEIARNQEQYRAEKSRITQDSDSYMGDDGDYEEYDIYDSPNSETGSRVEVIEGRIGVMKHIFELKVDELPCPKPSREDLMASEQPSSRHEHALMGSSATRITLSSAKIYLYASQCVIGVKLLMDLMLHFT